MGWETFVGEETELHSGTLAKYVSKTGLMFVGGKNLDAYVRADFWLFPSVPWPGKSLLKMTRMLRMKLPKVFGMWTVWHRRKE